MTSSKVEYSSFNICTIWNYNKYIQKYTVRISSYLLNITQRCLVRMKEIKKLWTCIGDDSAENDVNCTMSVKRMLTDSNASGSTNPRDCIWWAIDLQCERVKKSRQSTKCTIYYAYKKSAWTLFHIYSAGTSKYATSKWEGLGTLKYWNIN